MYESYYRLDRRPFLATPDPDCLVPVETTQKALAELGSCVESGRGIGVLSAEPGTGKTLLCRKLVVDLRDEFATVFLANSNFSNRSDLLQALLYELGQPYLGMGEQELRLQLKTAVQQVRREKHAVLIVVDEAHRLDNRLLEEIRIATGLQHDGLPLVRVLLSGQLALEEKLTDPDLDAVNQRLGCHVTLQRLTRQESAEYVAHRIQWAGGEIGEILRPEALEVICHASDGLPRCLNHLCDHTLLLGYVAGERPIEPATAREALDDLRQLPLHWNEPAGTKANVSPRAEPISDEPVETDLNPADVAAWETGGAPAASIEVGAIRDDDPSPDEAPTGTEPACDNRGMEPTTGYDGDIEVDESADVRIEDAEESVVEIGRGEWNTGEQRDAVSCYLDAWPASVAEGGIWESHPSDDPRSLDTSASADATLHDPTSRENPQATGSAAATRHGSEPARVEPGEDWQGVQVEITSAGVSRTATAAEEGTAFEEEVVVDHYAMLDAGKPLTADAPAAGESPSDAGETASLDPSRGETQTNQLLDEIGPMIDRALSDDEARKAPSTGIAAEPRLPHDAVSHSCDATPDVPLPAETAIETEADEPPPRRQATDEAVGAGRSLANGEPPSKSATFDETDSDGNADARLAAGPELTWDRDAEESIEEQDAHRSEERGGRTEHALDAPQSAGLDTAVLEGDESEKTMPRVVPGERTPRSRFSRMFTELRRRHQHRTASGETTPRASGEG